MLDGIFPGEKIPHGGRPAFFCKNDAYGKLIPVSLPCRATNFLI